VIRPHGGWLVNRIALDDEQEQLACEVSRLPQVPLLARELADLEMIATGAMSPLEGFMAQADYESVLSSMRLTNGLVWSLPVVLSAKSEEHTRLTPGTKLALVDGQGRALAIMELEDCYPVDPDYEAERVLRTRDKAHPGVQYLQSIWPVYLGGRITLFSRPEHCRFGRYRLEPKETRVLFEAKGWSTIAGFQTRNPIHRAHEYLLKCALEISDGLLIHPLVGETKADDIPAKVRMRCYEELLRLYYPQNRVVLSVLPAAMRYAGPREAIFHALVRKNYGCTHFIVGRDHAGLGSYYGTYDAHAIFREFELEEIGISPIFFDNAFFCRRCGGMVTAKTCPHAEADHLSFSGTQVRQLLAVGRMPPPEFTRPEVAAILAESMKAKG